MSRDLSSWLDSYLEYTENQESPEAFHFWTGLTVLSAALQRHVHLDRVWYKLYPNIYVLIVAESASARKSVAINMGLSILREALPDIYTIGDSLTREGLVKHVNRTTTETDRQGRKTMVKDSSLLIHADELANLFGYDRTAASRLTIFLTRCYESQDCYTHTTSGEGRVEIYNLYFNLLAATAPQNLKVVPEEAAGGLLGRLILVSAKHRRKIIAWGSRLPGEEDLRKSLVADLYRISKMEGEFQVTTSARELFGAWYERQAEIIYGDVNMDSFHARCHDTALKLACLFSVSGREDLIVDDKEMAKGIAIVERQLPEFSRVVQWAGASEFSRNRAKVFEVLHRNGGYATRKALLQAVNIPIADFDSLILTMREQGVVEERRLPTGVAFRIVEG